MTEKRFQWIYIKDNILELRDDGIVKVFNNERLEELLNELHKENEQLKQSTSKMIGYFERAKYAIKVEEWEGYNELLELLK